MTLSMTGATHLAARIVRERGPTREEDVRAALEAADVHPERARLAVRRAVTLRLLNEDAEGCLTMPSTGRREAA
jgi:hypothetical protein